MAPTATANADSAAPSTSPGDGNDGTSSSIAKRTIPGDYDKDIFNFAIGTAPCIVKRKRRKISQKNLKTRREKFFESMIDKLGRDDDGRIIKHYVGDMYTGGFKMRYRSQNLHMFGITVQTPTEKCSLQQLLW